MVVMPKKKPDAAESPNKKPKRNVIFVSLDDPTERALQKFQDAQRIRPDRAAVAFTALIEFLRREGFDPAAK